MLFNNSKFKNMYVKLYNIYIYFFKVIYINLWYIRWIKRQISCCTLFSKKINSNHNMHLKVRWQYAWTVFNMQNKKKIQIPNNKWRFLFFLESYIFN